MAWKKVFAVVEVLPRTNNVKSFRVAVDDTDPGYDAGQFMCVSLEAERGCKRYLSFSSSPTERGYFEFTKKITGSDFSRAIERTRPGDRLYIEYPLGKFILPSQPCKIAFLSGGIGITPIRSMCKYAADTQSGHDIVLLYGNRSFRDIVFRDDFQQMKEAYPKLRVVHVLCEPAENFACTVGLINAGVIREKIPDFAERRFYICGPPGMVDSMKRILDEELSLPKEQIITENFTGYE